MWLSFNISTNDSKDSSCQHCSRFFNLMWWSINVLWDLRIFHGLYVETGFTDVMGRQNFPRCLGENGFHKRKGGSTDKQGNFIEFHQSLTVKFCPQPPHCYLLHVAHKIISIKETHNPKLQWRGMTFCSCYRLIKIIIIYCKMIRLEATETWHRMLWYGKEMFLVFFFNTHVLS